MSRLPYDERHISPRARTMASTTPMAMTVMREVARTSRTCTTLQSVRAALRHSNPWLNWTLAQKEDEPEKALKEFQAIVDKEQEKGDW